MREGEMRTTLMIDDDVLAAARQLAERQDRTVGEVISDLARKALSPAQAQPTPNGIGLLPAHENPTPVTLELVKRLRDEAP
jgi:hypothetical protein